MKYFFALCCFLTTAMLVPGLAAADWHTDFEKAKAESLKTGRPIYILFTNSDAAPDRSLERTVFSQRKFQEYAERKLILMKVDFPVAIHLQPKSLSQQNSQLRAKFGITILPTALLLNAHGEIFIDFVKADGSAEKHRKKMNEIMDFEPPKRYAEYVEGYVKQYTPPKAEVKKADEKKADAKKPAKKPTKKPDKKPADKPQNDASADTIIPDENAGSPLIPLDPEGNFQDWLKSNQTEEAASETKETIEETEAVKETVEVKETIEETEAAKEEETKPQAPAEK